MVDYNGEISFKYGGARKCGAKFHVASGPGRIVVLGKHTPHIVAPSEKLTELKKELAELDRRWRAGCPARPAVDLDADTELEKEAAKGKATVPRSRRDELLQEIKANKRAVLLVWLEPKEK